MCIVAGDGRHVVDDTWCGMTKVVAVVLLTNKWMLVEHMIADSRELQ